MKRVLFVLLVAALACGSSTSTPAQKSEDDADLDAGSLTIDIGRLGVILDATHELAFLAPGAKRDYPASAADMNAALRATVWQFNLERTLICTHGYLRKHSCGPPYLPAWIHERPEVVPSLATISQRGDELGRRVVAFWDAACAEAEPRMKHEEWFSHCSIE